MPKAKSKTLLLSSVFIVLLNCCTIQKDAPLEQWFELEFIVDGKVDIQLAVPPAKAAEQLAKMGVISRDIITEHTQAAAQVRLLAAQRAWLIHRAGC